MIPMPPSSSIAASKIKPLNEVTFDPTVIDYLKLNDDIDKMQSEVRLIKKQQSDLGKSIMNYMQLTGFKKCAVENSSLQLSESVQQRPLTMALLQDIFKQKFPSRPDIQTTLLDAIVAARHHGGGDRIRLKRVKKRKTRAEKLADSAAAAAASN
jgi:hypothetical protein